MYTIIYLSDEDEEAISFRGPFNFCIVKFLPFFFSLSYIKKTDVVHSKHDHGRVQSSKTKYYYSCVWTTI